MSTAPVFVVEPARLEVGIPGSEVVIDGPEGHHAAQVRRIQSGERVDLVSGMGRRAHGVVVAVERARVTVRVDSATDDPPPEPRLVVVQALAKGDRGERAVELLTEVGVDEIVPWSAARSVVQWQGERGAKALQRWRSTARESSKQSRRARFTDVTRLADTAQVGARLLAAELAVVLSGDATDSLSALTLPGSGEVVLVVGPEGDLTDHELAAFDAAGAVRAALGPTVLRTSTAGVVAAAAVLSRTRW